MMAPASYGNASAARSSLGRCGSSDSGDRAGNGNVVYGTARRKDPELDREHQRVLEQLLAEPSNARCAECHEVGPRWASANLGVFVCIQCSGVHRSLGVHVSQVRSVNLDSWTPSQVRCVSRVGNRRAARKWEACLPGGFVRPAPGDVHRLQEFIRAKYVERRYESREYDPYAERASGGSGGTSGRAGAPGSHGDEPAPTHASERVRRAAQLLIEHDARTASPPSPPSTATGGGGGGDLLDWPEADDEAVLPRESRRASETMPALPLHLGARPILRDAFAAAAATTASAKTTTTATTTAAAAPQPSPAPPPTSMPTANSGHDPHKSRKQSILSLYNSASR